MLVQRPKPQSIGPQRYGVEQLGPAGAGLPRDPQLLQRLSAGLPFGFLEDPLCKVFALSKLLRKTPCSGLEPGKPLFQRFSWLRFFCIVKFTLFFCGVCPQNRKVAPQATFLAPQAKLFGPERLGSQENPFFGPKKPLVQHFAPPGKTPCAAF